ATQKYEQQDEEPGTQTVRVYGDTAVVTAKIWLKGTFDDGRRFDRRLWFSDTYVRTPAGWIYVLGQAGAPGLSPLTHGARRYPVRPQMSGQGESHEGLGPESRRRSGGSGD